jgi:hypothetical protein
MTTMSTAEGRAELAGADATETNLLGPDVDELDRVAIARYQSLRALGDAIRQAARRADARARLDASLALQPSRRPTSSIRSLDRH